MDVLIVSLGSTGGLRTADEQLLDSLRRAGASAAIARAKPPRPLRTLMLTDLLWASAARRAAISALQQTEAKALIYSSTTAALLWPRPGAIRFDAAAAGNRPGRHGLWQRPLERLRLRQAPLLLPWSEGALAEFGGPRSQTPTPTPTAQAAPPESRRPSPELRKPVPPPKSTALVLPVAIEPSPGPPPPDSHEAASQAPERDIAAFAYIANPTKKGLPRILDAWAAAHRPGERLVLAGAGESDLRALGYALPAPGVQVVPMLPYSEYRALLGRTRVFVCAARREDYGIAQLEALAEGCLLVTAPSPGPYAALPIARALDPRLVGEDLAGALRVALDDPVSDYAARAHSALAPFRRAQFDRAVAEDLLPQLLRLRQ